MKPQRTDFADMLGGRAMPLLESWPDALNAEANEAALRDATLRAMEALAVRTEAGEVYYEAAFPGYRTSFTRDSVLAMSLRGEPEVLLSQIDYSARRMGRRQNPYTGEEPGKPHHEEHGVEMNGRRTTYNACDAAALLLNGLAALSEQGVPEVLGAYTQTIRDGVTYIARHVDKRGLFVEDPVFSGAQEPDGRDRKFALKVTDWKDSELNRVGRREPHYPIVYSLAHFQNAEALRRIGRALDDKSLEQLGQNMIKAGLWHLWHKDHFVTAIDGDGEVDGPSSDSLYVLLYLEPEDIPKDYVSKIEQYMKQLETPAGYRSGIPVAPDVDPYHMMVWTHEQALLNAAARKHGLAEAETITRRIARFIHPAVNIFPEFINPDTLQPGGNLQQLWAMGAYLYFCEPDKAIL